MIAILILEEQKYVTSDSLYSFEVKFKSNVYLFGTSLKMKTMDWKNVY